MRVYKPLQTIAFYVPGSSREALFFEGNSKHSAICSRYLYIIFQNILETKHIKHNVCFSTIHNNRKKPPNFHTIQFEVMIEVKHQSFHWWGHLWWNCDYRGLSLCMIQLKSFKRCTCTYSDTHFVGSCCVVNCFLSLSWNTSKCQCILVLWNPLLYWIVSM